MISMPEALPSRQPKQRRHWSLIRMLHWPFRSPFSASRRFCGGTRKSSIRTAISSCLSFRSATRSTLANLATRRPRWRASVYRHLKDSIIDRLITQYVIIHGASRDAIAVTNPAPSCCQVRRPGHATVPAMQSSRRRLRAATWSAPAIAAAAARREPDAVPADDMTPTAGLA